MKITEPGLVYGMSDETYHADPVEGGSLSSSFARQLTNHVPAKARARHVNRKPTRSMNLGKAAHANALGAGPQLIVWEHDGRTKAGKEERAAVAHLIASEAACGVTPAERDQILGMAEVLRATLGMDALLKSCKSEVSAFWQEGGAWLRSRYDLLSDDAAWDYKTCQDASRRGFAKAMASYGYHQQGEFYQRGLRALGHKAAEEPMRFICQEVEEPYLVQIHTPDDDALEVARELNDRAIRIYAESTATGTWAGYDDAHAEPTSLPGYYFYDHEDVLPDHWQPGLDDLELKLA